MNDNLPLWAVTIKRVTPYILALFEAARLSPDVFLASRLSHPTEMCCGFSSFNLVNLTDILPSNNLIISTLYATAWKWTAVLLLVSRTETSAPFSVKKRRSSHLQFRNANISTVSRNLLAARISKTGFVASKWTNSAETFGVVISYAFVILTDIHLAIHTEKTAKWKQWCFYCHKH